MEKSSRIIVVLLMLVLGIYSSAEKIAKIGSFAVSKENVNGTIVFFASTDSVGGDNDKYSARLLLFCNNLRPAMVLSVTPLIHITAVQKVGGDIEVLFFANSSQPIISKWMWLELPNNDKTEFYARSDAIYQLIDGMKGSNSLMIKVMHEKKDMDAKTISFSFSLSGYADLLQYLPCLFAKRL